MDQLIKMLLSEKGKGHSRVTYRGALFFLVGFAALKLHSLDGRMATVEARLGITNPPTTITVPFVHAAQSNTTAGSGSQRRLPGPAIARSQL